MILSYLILAHLLGDFIFQPTKLVEWKMKDIRGVLVHVLVHFVLTSLILIPFLINGYAWLLYIALGLSVVHFFIDHAKINYDLKHDEKVKPFVIDQALHLLSILLAYFMVQDVVFVLPVTKFYLGYTSIKLVAFLSFAIFLGTVIEVFRYQRRREQNKKARMHINSNKMMSRILVFTLLYLVLVLLSFYAQAGVLPSL